jgi:hypothetical protein
MTEPPDPRFDPAPPQPPPLPVLNYPSQGSMPYRREGGEISAVQVVLTAVITVPVLVVITLFGILAIALGSGSAAGGWLIILAEVVLVNVWAFAAYKSEGWRGLAIGLWIGFGVAALIEGACFGLTMLN